jgi:hypothetical protein
MTFASINNPRRVTSSLNTSSLNKRRPDAGLLIPDIISSLGETNPNTKRMGSASASNNILDEFGV